MGHPAWGPRALRVPAVQSMRAAYPSRLQPGRAVGTILQAALIALFPFAARAMPQMAGDTMGTMDMLDSAKDSAPVDYGFGPDKGPAHISQGRRNAIPGRETGGYVLGAVPPAGPGADTVGYFDPPVPWPLIGLHQILLPDGRVLNYGSNLKGAQGAALYYDVWNPGNGTGDIAHLVLPNTTRTDIFCSAQSLMWATGEVLITGGDLTIDHTRNYSNNHTTIFSPQTDSIRSASPMQYPRWYPSIVALADDQMLVLGGRTSPTTPATTPEIFSSQSGWQTLTGAASDAAFGERSSNWFYPRAFVKPDGKVFLVDYSGGTWSIDTSNAGAITQLQTTTLPSWPTLPTVMYAPGKLLSLRIGSNNGQTVAAAETIDINGAEPIIAATGDIGQIRQWANATVLANGLVLINGGSVVANQLPAIFTTQIWHPNNGTWTTGASATIPRLYHSIALLLPDATVLTAAGGAPGPVRNLNAEIYYPPYLYRRNGSGEPARRPTLVTAQDHAVVGQAVYATVGRRDRISRVTFVRTGSVTHSFNNDQRFIDAPFTQSGTAIVATLPGNPNVVLPGYYMMFVFRDDTPSVAKIVRIDMS